MNITIYNVLIGHMLSYISVKQERTRMKEAISAVILAGGIGSRLGEITKNTPKPMLEFDGKPYIGYLIDWLKLSSIDDIIISTYTYHEQIEEYVSKNYSDVHVVVEPTLTSTVQGSQLGLAHTKNETSLILTADNIWQVKLDDLIKQHRKYKANATAMVTANPSVPNAGRVKVSDADDRILEMWPSPDEIGDMHHVRLASTMGLYVVNKTKLLESIRPSDTSIEREPMNRLTPKVAAYWNEGFFYDFGTPDKYEYLKANPHLITENLQY